MGGYYEEIEYGMDINQHFIVVWSFFDIDSILFSDEGTWVFFDGISCHHVDSDTFKHTNCYDCVVSISGSKYTCMCFYFASAVNSTYGSFDDSIV